MNIVIYKCSKCGKQRVNRDNFLAHSKSIDLKANYIIQNDTCPACKRIKRLNEERQVLLDQDLESFRKEYKTAAADRKEEIVKLVAQLKKDKEFTGNVIDNLI